MDEDSKTQEKSAAPQVDPKTVSGREGTPADAGNAGMGTTSTDAPASEQVITAPAPVHAVVSPVETAEVRTDVPAHELDGHGRVGAVTEDSASLHAHSSPRVGSPEPDLEILSDSEAERRIRRMSRRSFLWGAAAVADRWTPIMASGTTRLRQTKKSVQVISLQRHRSQQKQ